MNLFNEAQPPLPPLTLESAIHKTRAAEDAWNSRDPGRVVQAWTGNNTNVSSVEVSKPPITTTARGRCNSEPGPVASNLGTRPRLAMSAVNRE